MSKRPTVFGTGLLALDLVVCDGGSAPPRSYAGGTCGNVLTILSYFGWHASPIARLGSDQAARTVQTDLSRWGVDLTYASLAPAARTPIFMERLRRDAAGVPYHTFSWYCQHCGGRYPGYSPVPLSAVVDLLERLKSADVFFFDRVSRGALQLALTARANGAVVFFEPSGVGDASLFEEALEICHILKYSQERMKSFEQWIRPQEPTAALLEIETLGRGGLRFRSRTESTLLTSWKHVEAYPVRDLTDAAGCGDWCTAGIIDLLCQGGAESFRQAEPAALLQALRLGQALAAWNCSFEGARSGMYGMEAGEVRKVAEALVSGTSMSPSQQQQPDELPNAAVGFCSSCTRKTRSSRGTPPKSQRPSGSEQGRRKRRKQ